MNRMFQQQHNESRDCKKTSGALVGVTTDIRTGILRNTSLNHQYSSQVALNYSARTRGRCKDGVSREDSEFSGHSCSHRTTCFNKYSTFLPQRTFMCSDWNAQDHKFWKKYVIFFAFLLHVFAVPFDHIQVENTST